MVHVNNTTEARRYALYSKELSSSQRAVAYQAAWDTGSSSGSASTVNISNSGAPAGASFFEIDYRTVWWVDVDDPRVVYMSKSYGQNPMRLKYAIDTTLPIYPSLGSTQQLGDPFLIYHTSGVTRGIVVAYLDENDTTQGECAE